MPCDCVVEMRECLHHLLTTEDEARIERCLARAGHPRPPSRKQQPAPVACTGAMLCECERCTEQRHALVLLGPRRHASQPWHALTRAA